MNCGLLDTEELQGLLLVRNKADLSAAFLVPYFTQLALAANLRVVLLMVQDSVLHYQSALRKLGINLAASIEAKKILPINAAASIATPDYFRSLYQQLVIACEQPPDLPSSAGVCVLIDSASQTASGLNRKFAQALAGVANQEQQWQAFLHYCQVPPPSLQGQYACVMSVQDDVEADIPWVSWLRHQAQIELEVVALESGASQDINGQVIVTRRRSSRIYGDAHGKVKAEALQSSKRISFKLGPSDIRLFQ